jgi:hypothetical protein
MIVIRFDVDYPYPSRLRSIFYVLRRGKKEGKDYLRNAKIIAKMINESALEIKAYWFFTPYTTPDQELLELLNPQKHEIGVHVAVDANAELEVLEKATKRKIEYYTIHGTERLLGRLIWGRKRSQAKVEVSKEVPLKSFHDFAQFTVGLDRLAYDHPLEKVLEAANNTIVMHNILHAHPEWLFQKGKFNHRGPYYEELRRILEVDKEFDALETRKKGFIKIGKYSEQNEYTNDVNPDKDFIEKLAKNKIDFFTFIERKWTRPIANPSKQWRKAEDNIALLQVSAYETWWESIDKKTRNMVRKAEKSEIKVEVVEPSDKLAEGIWKIYNETPFRQGRAFSHYGQSLESVKNAVYGAKNDTFIAATLNGEVVGFIQLVYGDNIAIISQILSLQQHWDKAVNNVLVAKAVEVCASKNVHWVMYGRIGNHPSLDKFKESNNFTKYPLTRYYIPLSRIGRIAVALGLHRNLKDVMPESLKKRLFGVYNWVSRTKTKLQTKK